MNNDFNDITDKLGEPIWYDKLGVPRYCKFHPSREHNIYAKYVAYILIACQDCGKKMRVATSIDRLGMHQRDWHHEIYTVLENAGNQKNMAKKLNALKPLIHRSKKEPESVILKRHLPNKKSLQALRYGDPPHHNNILGEFCHAGGTMTSDVVKVLQFWKKDDNHKWVRDKKYEITYNEHKEKMGW